MYMDVHFLTSSFSQEKLDSVGTADILSAETRQLQPALIPSCYGHTKSREAATKCSAGCTRSNGIVYVTTHSQNTSMFMGRMHSRQVSALSVCMQADDKVEAKINL